MSTKLPTIEAVLYTSKTLASGEHPIMIRVSYDGKRKYKSTGLSCAKDDWNPSSKNNKVRGNSEKARSMNAAILNLVSQADTWVKKCIAKEMPFSAQTIVDAIGNNTPSTRVTLYSLFEERVKYFSDTAKQYNTSSGYQTLLNIIKRYTDNEDCELFEIDEKWIASFEAHLRTKYKDTSIRRFFDNLRAAFNYAVKQKYIEVSPFSNYQLIRKLDRTTQKRALPISSILQLMTYYIDTYGAYNEKEKPNLERTNKHYWNKKFRRRAETKLAPIDAEQLSIAMFLCSYLLQGLALVDMAKLRWRDFNVVKQQDDKQFTEDVARHGIQYAQEHLQTIDCYDITTIRSKSGTDVHIRIECDNIAPFLQPFIDCINEDVSDEEFKNMYVFPIYSSQDVTEHQKYCRRRYAVYLINHNLQIVAERLGIGKITFYSARHSYASVLYHAEVAEGLIAQNMGRSIKDIETYLKEFDDEKILEANRKALLYGQDAFVQAKEVAAKNNKALIMKRKQLAEWQKKKETEEAKVIKKYGSVEAYNESVKREQENLRQKLDDMFGDDLQAKIDFLKQSGTSS